MFKRMQNKYLKVTRQNEIYTPAFIRRKILNLDLPHHYLLKEVEQINLFRKLPLSMLL